MLDDELRVTVRDSGPVKVIDLEGDVTTFALDKVRNAFAEAARDDARSILLYFRQNDYINSRGIAILIEQVHQASKAGRTVAICGLSDHFQNIFRMVGLTQYLNIYQTEAEALAALTQH